MKHIIIGVMLYFLCIGCASPKFYPEMKSTYEGKPFKKYDYHKMLLKKMDKKLNNTNHIIYIYMPDYAAISSSTMGFLYDVDNNIYYEISFDDIPNIKIKKLDKYPKDVYETFVLENYLNGKHEYLKSLGYKLIASRGEIISNSIYDINLKNKIYTKFTFWNFPFFEGKPFDGNVKPW